MDDSLTKPAELAALKAMLEHWLPSADPACTVPAPHVEPVDPKVLAGMIGEDEAVLASFLMDFARAASEAAMAMELALGLGRRERVGFVAHQLKASARSIGSFRLGNLCAALEEAAAQADDPALTTSWTLFQAELSVVQCWIAERSSGAADLCRGVAR